MPERVRDPAEDLSSSTSDPAFHAGLLVACALQWGLCLQPRRISGSERDPGVRNVTRFDLALVGPLPGAPLTGCNLAEGVAYLRVAT